MRPSSRLRWQPRGPARPQPPMGAEPRVLRMRPGHRRSHPRLDSGGPRRAQSCHPAPPTEDPSRPSITGTNSAETVNKNTHPAKNDPSRSQGAHVCPDGGGGAKDRRVGDKRRTEGGNGWWSKRLGAGRREGRRNKKGKSGWGRQEGHKPAVR